MSRRGDINYPVALWRRRWIIAPFVLLGLIGALVAFSRMTRLYRGSATVILVPQSISDSIYSQRGEQLDALRTLDLELSSLSFLEELAAAFEVQAGDPRQLRALTRDFELREVDPETFLFLYVDPDPAESARRANLVARTLVDHHRKRKVEETVSSARFLEDDIKRLEREIGTAKNALASYQADHRGELPSDRQAHRTEQSFLRTRLSELDSRIEAKNKDIEQRSTLVGRAPDASNPQALSEARIDPRLARLADLRGNLADANLRYTNRHPEVKRLQGSVDALLADIRSRPFRPEPGPVPAPREIAGAAGNDGALKQFLGLEITRIETEINELEAEKKRTQVRIDRLERLIQRSFSRQTELDRLNGNIDLLEGRLLENRGQMQSLETEREVFERGMDERFAVKRQASIPLLPFRPDLLQLLIIGLGAGATLGIGLALTRELLDTAVRTPEDVEALVQTTVLVSIPDMDRVKRGGPSAVPGPRKAARG